MNKMTNKDKRDLLTPNGSKAGTMDRVMLLALWTKALAAQDKQMISAGMGKPTFAMNPSAAGAMSDYSLGLERNSRKARVEFAQTGVLSKKHGEIASDYGHPQGDPELRERMASALNSWYGEGAVSSDAVLFTVGGAGGLRAAFSVLNKKYPHCRIVTPFPHYSLYAGPGGSNHLQPVNVMQQPGYRLTASAIEAAIKQAIAEGEEAIRLGREAIDGGLPKALLFCDPNNPLGTRATEAEMLEIAELMRKHPDILIILDEAYAEMCLDGQPNASLLRLAPDLKERIILMRSGTKGMSAAGERMAVTVVHDKQLMADFLQENIDNIGHAPTILQEGFTAAMEALNRKECETLINFYGPKVATIQNSVSSMGASLPDQSYKTEGTFYVLADLSDLLGTMDIAADAEKALGRTGKIETDEDIIYSLLFDEGLMLCPLSYFGMDPKLGYVRITCSGDDNELAAISAILEKRLVQARSIKQTQLIKQLNKFKIKVVDRRDQLGDTTKNIMTNLNLAEKTIDSALLAHGGENTAKTALTLKAANNSLRRALTSSHAIYATCRTQDEKEDAAATIIAAWFRGNKARQEVQRLRKDRNSKNEQYLQSLQSLMQSLHALAPDQLASLREEGIESLLTVPAGKAATTTSSTETKPGKPSAAPEATTHSPTETAEEVGCLGIRVGKPGFFAPAYSQHLKNRDAAMHQLKGVAASRISRNPGCTIQ